MVVFSTRKVILGRIGQELTKIVKRKGDFIIVSTVFLLNGPFLLTKYPYNFKKVSTDFENTLKVQANGHEHTLIFFQNPVLALKDHTLRDHNACILLLDKHLVLQAPLSFRTTS